MVSQVDNGGLSEEISETGVSLLSQVKDNRQVVVSTGYGTGVSVVKVNHLHGLSMFSQSAFVLLTFDPTVCAAEDCVLRDGEHLGDV